MNNKKINLNKLVNKTFIGKSLLEVVLNNLHLFEINFASREIYDTYDSEDLTSIMDKHRVEFEANEVQIDDSTFIMYSGLQGITKWLDEQELDPSEVFWDCCQYGIPDSDESAQVHAYLFIDLLYVVLPYTNLGEEIPVLMTYLDYYDKYQK